MTTDKLYTRDDLTALDLTDLRRVFTQVTKLGPGTRKPATIITAILDAQAESTPQADDQDDDHDQDDRDPEGSTVDSTATADQAPEADPEPTKVKVTGTGAHTGSTLLCELVSFTGTIAVVNVLGSEVRFITGSGEAVRSRKSWQTAGWQLDLASLPSMPEPSIEELSELPARDLSIQQLQQVYQHLSGRSTTSESRTYLLARIKAAKAGSLPTGTRRSRSGEPMKVLPLGMPESVVEALDKAWRRLGFKSRVEFLRQAIHDKLQAEGEDAVAELVQR